MSNPYPPPNPYAPQGPPPQPNPYGAAPVPPPYGYPPAPGYGYGPAYGYPGAAASGPTCRFCGGFPAVDVTVRGHRGMIVVMRFLRQRGPFCRICGTATVRDMSQKTLLLGWWSYLSSLFTIITLLRNRAAYARIRQLPPPAPGTHGPQLDPGVPLTKRGAIFMLALPIVSVLLVVLVLVLQAVLVTGTTATSLPSAPATNAGSSGVITAKAGDCVHNEHQSVGTDDATPKLVILPCSDNSAEYKVAGRISGTSDGATACPQQYPSANTWYTREDGANSFVLCLVPN